MCGAAVAGGSLMTANAQSDDPMRPNILCITCEDISCYLGCYGDEVARTPNLDRLASQSIRYTNMHTPNGVSSPSRFALITGMYPSACGANYMRASYYDYDVCLPDNIKAYTEYMRAAGYFCTNNSKTDYQISTEPTHWDENSATATWKDCPEGQPFFSIFNIGTTHESQLWSRHDPLETQPEDIDMSKFPYLPDVKEVRNDLARMYTNIAIMDRETQAIIDEMEAAGLADNTIVIWYSDNGGPIPRGKRSIYNTGTNVPFMIRFPDGYRAGEVEDRLVSFIDIPATILSLAGIDVPDYMHGRPFLGAQVAPPAEYVFSARDRYDDVADHSAGVRDKRFHYIRNFMPDSSNYIHNYYRLSLPMMQKMLEMRDAGELNEDQMKYFSKPRPVEEFYDLANDPYELHNIADDPMFRYDLERLRAAFDEWNGTVNLVWNTKTEEDWIAEFKPGGERRHVSEPVIVDNGGMYEFSCDTPGVSYVYRITDARTLKAEEAEARKAAKEAEARMKDIQERMAASGQKMPAGGFRMFGGGKDESKGWSYYTGPIESQKGKILQVRACRAGYVRSDVVSYKMK